MLRDRANLLVHLRPTALVARVATTTGTVRPGDAWLVRELAMTRHLAAVGAPVVPPAAEIAPGPHHHDGLVLSFWQFVEELEEPADPRAAGRALRECHEALSGFDGELPWLGCPEETARLLSRLVAEGVPGPADADLLRRANERFRAALGRLELPMQPLHGDAHLGNVLNTKNGPVWGDWEDAFLGPLDWDLGCLVTVSRVFGTDLERGSAALHAYGATIDEERLEFFVEARALQAVVWTAIVARQHPERWDRFQAWLDGFRALHPAKPAS